MKKFNTQYYQIMVDGKETSVTDASEDSVRQELCNAIEYIEIMDTKIAELQSIISGWRNSMPEDEFCCVPKYENV